MLYSPVPLAPSLQRKQSAIGGSWRGSTFGRAFSDAVPYAHGAGDIAAGNVIARGRKARDSGRAGVSSVLHAPTWVIDGTKEDGLVGLRRSDTSTTPGPGYVHGGALVEPRYPPHRRSVGLWRPPTAAWAGHGLWLVLEPRWHLTKILINISSLGGG